MLTLHDVGSGTLTFVEFFQNKNVWIGTFCSYNSCELLYDSKYVTYKCDSPFVITIITYDSVWYADTVLYCIVSLQYIYKNCILCW